MVHSDRVLLGGSISRNNIHATIEGEHAESAFNGIFLPEDRQHMDSHIRVEHMAEDCHSRQHYRGLLADRGKGVFTGRIYVKDVAQKTDAIQHNSNLLLSRTAQMTTKPQLEIYADDVRCTHGATSGELDENSLFYLRARGVSEATARLLLLHAFAGENIDRIEHEDTRDAVRAIINDRLAEALKRNA
jgi:Fe-S cluster assembly protein SufD